MRICKKSLSRPLPHSLTFEGYLTCWIKTLAICRNGTCLIFMMLRTPQSLTRDMDWLEQACTDFAAQYQGQIAALDAGGLLAAVQAYETH